MINAIIEKRYSPRAFDSKALSDDQITTLFEAARQAPSAMNEQPWRFIYAQKKDTNYALLFDALLDGNKEWAISAPLIMVGVAKENYDYKNRPNNFANYDLGQAMAYLSIQATELGLHLHQMGGFDAQTAKNNLNLPEGFQPFVYAVIGYKGKPEQIPKKFHEGEQNRTPRKAINEIAAKNYLDLK